MNVNPALAAIEAGLEVLFPEPRCALDHADAWQLLVATVLSAQSTDVRVNEVTPPLFARYPCAAAMAAAEPEDLLPTIRPVGLFNNKAKSLVGLSRLLVERHAGVVPNDLDALTALPGVARKTANVVLQNIWNRNEGFVVDTHVARLSGRLGLSAAATPEKIERDLMACFARDVWGRRSHQLILLGRSFCGARRPECGVCPLRLHCPTGRGTPPDEAAP